MLVPLALVDRNPQPDPARLAVLRVLQVLDLRLADARPHVAFVQVELVDQLGVVGELRLEVRAAAREKPMNELGLFSFIWLRSVRVAERRVAVEHHFAQLVLRALIDGERQVDELRPGGQLLRLRLDLDVVVALLRSRPRG